MYTKREFIENYGDTEEWEAAKPIPYKLGLDILGDPVWTYESLGLRRKNKAKKKKTKKKKTKKNKTKKTKKKKTKRGKL